MKLPFTIYDLRFTIWKKSGRAGSPLPADAQLRRARSDAPCLSQRGLQPLAFSIQPSQHGVALIITLILLGVVTFMAIAFLALSRRERGAVTTVTDTTSARLAADAALANAEAQIVANVLSTTNPCNFGLLVSSNYINQEGYIPALGASLTNVNYFDSSGNFLTGNNFLQNLANLYYSPRPPVFIPTNSLGSNDFRFYLDLNRNERFDANGLQMVISPDPAKPYYDTNGNTMAIYNPPNVLSNIMVGDPEWIGVLQRPDQPYGPNNPFVARYAFIALPVGNTLDLNAIHNQALIPALNNPMNPMNSADDSYFRNQGVGSWEINLAAFLADLNTNQWDNPLLNPYNYYRPVFPNTGYAFQDALSLLSYRYGFNYGSLSNAATLLNGALGFAYDNIDGYSDGPLQTGFPLPGDNDNSSLQWAGADNINHYFTPSELFNPSETANNVVGTNFTQRLQMAGNGISTYDRYTFYRLLSQLGTDSTPDSGRMNLNYSNALVLYDNYGVATNISIIPEAETNFVPWRPLDFFTVAADRLLRAYTAEWRTGNPTNFATTFYSVTDFSPMFFNPSLWTNYPAFGIGRIPVLVSNQFVYSSAVNRLLQLAANIYDATTNRTDPFLLNSHDYPSVFRPLFSRDSGGNVFVTGYAYVPSVSGAGDIAFSQPFDVSTISASGGSNVLENVYGVPWIIGAKKGFPNFNKFAMQDIVQIQRKLQLTSTKAPAPQPSDIIITNQMYIFGISNSIGMDLWNSYATNYPDTVQIVVNYNLQMWLTNDTKGLLRYTNLWVNVNTPYSPWPGTGWTSNNLYSSATAANSFTNPINTTVAFLTNSVYYSGSTPPGVSGFYPDTGNLGWETTKPVSPLPQFGLVTTNHLQVFMLGGSGPNYHVIDYAQFAGPDSSRNLNAEFQTSGQSAGFEYQWSTNVDTYGTPYGIISQIVVSEDAGSDQNLQSQYWNGTSPSQVSDEQAGFRWYMGLSSSIDRSNPNQSPYTNTTVQVPYTPTATICEYVSWQANDPLVHYLVSDLNFRGTENFPTGPTTGITTLSSQNVTIPRPSFNQKNDRYQPWGVLLTNNVSPAEVDVNAWNLMYKDPLVRISDNWDFPTNKFPTVGWLGRVHRGTPWQTVYLKASDILKEIQPVGPNNYLVGTNTWAQWTGDTQLTYGQYFDAANSAPVQDRLLFDLFTTAFNDNATRGTLSVNQNHLAAWSALLSGVVVLSNNVPDNHAASIFPQYMQFQKPPPSYSVTNIQPAGPAWTNSPLGQLVNGINQTRANFKNADGLVGAFEHVGDILSVPQFTEQSPFMKAVTNGVADAAQRRNGISDEMYEWLPQQTMSLLRASDSPRYVIYSYGQTLKPAPDSVYTTGGPFFGMITNYQIVSEIATRAVVRFNSTVTNVVTYATDGLTYTNWFSTPVVTNNNAVIESFNILPPD
jgi:hypothetical protein